MHVVQRFFSISAQFPVKKEKKKMKKNSQQQDTESFLQSPDSPWGSSNSSHPTHSPAPRAGAGLPAAAQLLLDFSVSVNGLFFKVGFTKILKWQGQRHCGLSGFKKTPEQFV